jgi:hypothetical protein
MNIDSNLSQIHFHFNMDINHKIILNNLFLHEFIFDSELENILLAIIFIVRSGRISSLVIGVPSNI